MKILLLIYDYRTKIIFVAVCLLLIFISFLHFNLCYTRDCEYIHKYGNMQNLTCRIASFPTQNDINVSVICNVTDSKNKGLCGKNIVTQIQNADAADFSYGDIINFTANIQAEQPDNIPFVFNYSDYLKSCNAIAFCYTKGAKIAVHKKSFMTTICDIRKNISKQANRYFTMDNSGIVKALVCGDRSGLSDKLSDDLKKCGIYHIVAISGMHLNIFILYIGFVISKMEIRKKYKTLILPLIYIISALFILIFTGSGVSVIRAFIMLASGCFAMMFSRTYNAKNSLLVSAFIILLIRPYSIYSMAMWLSFLSTLAVLISIDLVKALYCKHVHLTFFKNTIVHTVIISLMVIVFTLPVSGITFGYIPSYSWLANIFILPLIPATLGLSALFSVLVSIKFYGCAWLISCTVSGILNIILYVAGRISDLPFSTLTVYPSDAMSILITIALILLCVYLYKDKRTRQASAVLIAFTVALSVNLLYNKLDENGEVVFADVGQGDCTIIQLPNDKAYMIDCGSSSSSENIYDDVTSMLRIKNIRHIDNLFISHFDYDHISICTNLLENGFINSISLPLLCPKGEDFRGRILYDEIIQKSVENNVHIHYLDAGDKIEIYNDTYFKVLYPSETDFKDANNMSMVIKMVYGDVSFVFPGDIEEDGGKALISDYSEKCTLLHIPHHGAKSEIIDEFLDNYNPEYAIISCGKNNIYGHPHKSTINELGKRKIKYFRTDENKNVTFDFNKDEIIKTDY